MRKMLLTSAAAMGIALVAPGIVQTANAATDRNGVTTPPPHRLMREGAMNPTTGARWGHVPGVGISLPTSAQASNITPGDTRSIIAPTLPKPPVSPDAGTQAFLNAAHQAVAAHRTGEAQEALERAMTRRLDGDVLRGVSIADDPMIGQIRGALDSLANRQYSAVQQQIATAESNYTTASTTPGPEAAPPGTPMNPGGTPQ